MAWAMWLAVPVAITVLAALCVWWRGRPRPAPTVQQTVRAHHEYLDALAAAARGLDSARSDGTARD
jgi:hypothetical protein